MEDQKDKQCRIIFYRQFSSYLPGVTLILTVTVISVCEYKRSAKF